MFGKKNTMKSLIGSFTSEAKAIAKEQKKIAEDKLKEIEAAQAVFDAALEEAASAEAFIANMNSMCCPVAKAGAVATEVK